MFFNKFIVSREFLCSFFRKTFWLSFSFNSVSISSDFSSSVESIMIFKKRFLLSKIPTPIIYDSLLRLRKIKIFVII